MFNGVNFFRRNPSAVHYWLIPSVFLCLLTSSISADKLALILAGTLKTFQRHECQGSTLTLQCPLNTTIDILHANYGGARPPLCPLPVPVSVNHADVIEEGRCTYPDAVNHKTIKRVADLCRTKQNCHVAVPSPMEISEEDPCPSVNKYIEVAYKCRPDRFINKILCEGERLTLNCGPQSRIAVYNAIFGRTKHGSELCPQRLGYPEDECQGKLVTELVRKDCHGAIKCEIYASSDVFGQPCPTEYSMYMKVVYTCVPSWVLKPAYQKPYDSKSVDSFEATNENPDPRVADRPHNHADDTQGPPLRHPTLVPKIRRPFTINKEAPAGKGMSTKDLINCTVTILSGSPNKEVGIITEWMKAVQFINNHIEKFILYMVVGLIVAILLFVLVVSVRLIRDRRKLRSEAKEASQFIADIEDVDGDIDMMTPTNTSSDGGYSPSQHDAIHQPQRPPVVRYNTGPRLGSRYNDVDLIPPRSLSRENNHYFYS